MTEEKKIELANNLLDGSIKLFNDRFSSFSKQSAKDCIINIKNLSHATGKKVKLYIVDSGGNE
ncbi:hypothetical protein [Francisella hispaniensis]|uniref:Uncharacterized protein n=1 Tax=Francisella hispaniensis FSC454 TaxID=1088883 RepID=A0AAC9JA37_9GAMM|nr:hypothetical protein [Francisella hispaniensis]APD50192.1 hypothetical protein FSC454_03075 [Francisella hispaniensis FSC454]KYW83391.1 hypothetical protein AUF42_05930 [Francisella hispaniensis FSC454]